MEYIPRYYGIIASLLWSISLVIMEYIPRYYCTLNIIFNRIDMFNFLLI
jgi:hypothetical protein